MEKTIPEMIMEDPTAPEDLKELIDSEGKRPRMTPQQKREFAETLAKMLAIDARRRARATKPKRDHAKEKKKRKIARASRKRNR